MIQISDQLKDLLKNGNYRKAHLVTLLLNNPINLYFTENSYDLVYQGNTFLANGLLLDMGEPIYTSDLRINESNLVLSGADQSTLAFFLNDSQFNARVLVERIYFDNKNNVVGEPIKLANYRVMGFSMKDSANDESAITIKLGSEYAVWEKPSGRRTTLASQKRFNSGDLGFEFTDSIDEQITWGAE